MSTIGRRRAFDSIFAHYRGILERGNRESSTGVDTEASRLFSNELQLFSREGFISQKGVVKFLPPP